MGRKQARLAMGHPPRRRTRRRRLQGAQGCRELGVGLPLPPGSSMTSQLKHTQCAHTHRAHPHMHTGIRPLCTHTRAPSFCRIRFTEEKTSVKSTGKLYLKYKFRAYLPASLFSIFPLHLSTTVLNPAFQTNVGLTELGPLCAAEPASSHREPPSLSKAQAGAASCGPPWP